MTWTNSSSVLGLALLEKDCGKRAGSVTEPDNSSASEATRESMSSILPTGPWEEENGTARGAESLSEKKSYPRTQKGETETLAMRAVSPAECSVSVGIVSFPYSVSDAVHVKYWKGTKIQPSKKVVNITKTYESQQIGWQFIWFYLLTHCNYVSLQSGWTLLEFCNVLAVFRVMLWFTCKNHQKDKQISYQSNQKWEVRNAGCNLRITWAKHAVVTPWSATDE